jgi:hypothetical protein
MFRTTACSLVAATTAAIANLPSWRRFRPPRQGAQASGRVSAAFTERYRSVFQHERYCGRKPIGRESAQLKATITIDVRSGLADLEQTIDALADGGRPGQEVIRLTSSEKAVFLKEIWCAMVVAAAYRETGCSAMLASGTSAWPDLEAADVDDDGSALSLPAMLALQLGMTVMPDPGAPSLSPEAVRRHVAQRRSGVLGAGGKRRSIVEFDPEEPVATILGRGAERKKRFDRVVLELMTGFAVGATSRGVAITGTGARAHVITFLRELHSNGYAYARDRPGVRTIRLQKHLSTRERTVERAASFPQLADYAARLDPGQVNLVETSVSDFGPGILGGFMSTPIGRTHQGEPPERILDELLHEQLSGNADDPNAGLGIPNALGAARQMHAFVSLRTGPYWMVLDSSLPDFQRMKHVPGPHPEVRGTHWSLFFPDLMPSGAR